MNTERLSDTELDTLISDAFGYARPAHYLQDFPVWAPSRNDPQNTHFFKRSATGKLIAHVGLRKGDVAIADLSGVVQIFPTALIGAVVTHPDARGQGLAQNLLQDALLQARAQGCVQILMWGSLNPMYQRLGFDYAGTQIRVPLKEWKTLNTADSTLKIHEGFCDAIAQAFLSQKTGLRFLPSDVEWLSQQNSVRWFWTARPFAAVAMGRGMDLPGMVHEHLGDPAGLQSLYAHILKFNTHAELLLSPELAAHFKLQSPLSKSWISEPQCLAIDFVPGTWVSGLGAV